MTYEQADTHYALLQSLKEEGFFNPSGQHATTSNPQWFDTEGSPTPERKKFHNEIQRHALNGTLAQFNQGQPIPASQPMPPRQLERPIAILLAGPPGSGKSTAKREVFGEIEGKPADPSITSGLSSSDFVLIDVDEIKTSLINQARADGSLDTFIKPEQVRTLESDGERFSDLDFASLVHAESAFIGDHIQQEAIAQRCNIVFDQVCAHAPSTHSLVDELAQAGYCVRVIELQATRELSEKSIFNRYRRDQAEHGTGRYVPTEVLSKVYTTDSAGNEISNPQRTIDTLLAQHPCKIEAARRYLSTEIGAPPHLLSTHQRQADGTMRTTINPEAAPAHTPPPSIMGKKDALARLSAIKKDKLNRPSTLSPEKRLGHSAR